MSDLDTRSTDGSDTAGSLCDFVVDDDASDATVDGATPQDDDVEEDAVPAYPFDPAVLAAHMVEQAGPRRSMRSRREPVRYVDDEMARLLLSDDDAVTDSDDESSHGDVAGDSDGSYDPTADAAADDATDDLTDDPADDATDTVADATDDVTADATDDATAAGAKDRGATASATLAQKGGGTTSKGDAAQQQGHDDLVLQPQGPGVRAAA